MHFQSLLKRFLIWRLRHIQHWHFVLLLSVVIGFASGLVAVTIKNSVHFIEEMLSRSLVNDYHNYLYFAYPIVGIALAYLIIKFVIRKPIRMGVPTILYAISKRNAIMRSHHMFSSVITSALTVGFGGSVGLEAPTAISGSAIGSNLGRLLHMNYKTRTLLIGCAAAGTVASIFNAPIAGIIFAIEVIMLDLTMASLIPLLMASASAAITSRFFLGDDILFHFSLQELFSVADLPYYVGLGLVGGLMSLYFTRVSLWISKRFGNMQRKRNKLLTGGLILGALIFIFPPLYGEGYNHINALVEGNYQQILNNTFFDGLEDNVWVLLGFLGALALFKTIATSVTIGAGGVGGIFAPALFIGSSLGFVFARLCNLMGWHQVSESNFTLVGMSAVMAGVMHAPLTAIFLIAEITSGYGLFIPLMISSSIAYVCSSYFERHSVYTFQLAKRGNLITHHKDKAILSRMKLEKIVEKDLSCVHPEMTLGELIQVIAKSKRNIFPVVDKDNTFLGIIALDDVRGLMFDQTLYKSETVETLMRAPLGTLSFHDSMEKVMNTFKETAAWNLPVLEQGKYVGYISKSKLFSVYRRMLVEVSED